MLYFGDKKVGAKRVVIMEQQIFTYSLIIEGTTEKVWKVINLLKSIYSKTLVSLNTYVFLNNTEMLQNVKILLNGSISQNLNCSVHLFRAALYKLFCITKSVAMRLRHSQDASTFPSFKMMCFV